MKKKTILFVTTLNIFYLHLYAFYLLFIFDLSGFPIIPFALFLVQFSMVIHISFFFTQRKKPCFINKQSMLIVKHMLYDFKTKKMVFLFRTIYFIFVVPIQLLWMCGLILNQCFFYSAWFIRVRLEPSILIIFFLNLEPDVKNLVNHDFRLFRKKLLK